MTILSILILIWPLSAKTARELGAHSHGSGSVSIAFDQTIGKVELQAAADGIVGFEHQPKSAAQKDHQTKALAKLSDQISKMVCFDPALGCVWSPDHVEMKPSSHEGEAGEHADVDASWNVTCKQDPMGSKITFHIQKAFPGLKEVSVLLLDAALQKTVDARHDGASLELK